MPAVTRRLTIAGQVHLGRHEAPREGVAAEDADEGRVEALDDVLDDSLEEVHEVRVGHDEPRTQAFEPELDEALLDSQLTSLPERNQEHIRIRMDLFEQRAQTRSRQVEIDDTKTQIGVERGAVGQGPVQLGVAETVAVGRDEQRRAQLSV